MPSVKKTVPSRKTKAAVPEAKSPKQRSSKPARSKTASRPSRSKPAAKPTASKQKAKTAAAARTSVAKTSVTKSAVAKKKPAGATARRKSEARVAAPVKRNASAAKTSTAAKRTRKTTSPKTDRAAARSARTSVATSKSKPAVKPTQKKTTKAAIAAPIKRQEKQVKLVPASTQAARKKAASAISALAKATRSAAGKPDNVTEIRGAPLVQVAGSTHIVSEAVVVLPVAAGPTAGAGESRALALEAVTVTLETSDHQPVTQKIQKKTVATPVPSAELPGSTDKISSVKAAADKPIVAEAKLRETKAAVAPASEAKPVEAAIAPAKPKAAVARPGFKTTEFIVYPAHGVGQIIAVEEQEVAGFKLELFVISFIKDKMILKVPVPKATSVGMRKLGSADVVKKALGTLTGRARVKRTMWSRRAQEYEAKINSGDLVAIAEVVRDLYRSEAQPEQSYSERQLYEAALDRVAREIAVVQKMTETESLRLIESQLQKGPRRSKAEEAEGDVVDADEGDIEEAA
jgi:CarD family transcriptional regulator